MIDWVEQGRATAAVAADPDGARRVVDQEVGAAPVLRNRDFWLSPVPVYVRGDAVPEHADTVARYVALLDHLVRLYRREEEVRSYFGLDEAACDLVLAADPPAGTVAGGAPLPEVWICRVDGYLEQGSLRPAFLENNADAPAGTLFTPRINAAVDRMQRRLGAPAPAPGGRRWAFDEDDAFLASLLAAAGARGVDAPDVRLAVLQPAQAPNRESVELVAQATRQGWDAFLADPTEIELDGDDVLFAGRRATLCWNKVNTATWNRLTAGRPAVLAAWRKAVTRPRFVAVNPFGARYVAESKLALAMCQEPAFAALLDADQRELVSRVLPWARRLARRMELPDGCRPDDPTGYLVDRQHQLVIKEPYDIRGDGVTVGLDVPAGRWLERVEAGLARGWVVQEYVPPARCPVMTADGGIASMAVSLDSFAFGGRFHGFGSKASHAARVNVFQGGAKVAVRVGGAR